MKRHRISKTSQMGAYTVHDHIGSKSSWRSRAMNSKPSERLVGEKHSKPLAT